MVRETHTLRIQYFFYFLNLESVARPKQTVPCTLILSATLLRTTDSELRGIEKFIWRMCDYACRFDCGWRIEENVKQTTRRFFIRTFNSTLWIVGWWSDDFIWLSNRRANEQSFSSRYSRECFSSCDRRIIFATFSRNEKWPFQTTIRENCLKK